MNYKICYADVYTGATICEKNGGAPTCSVQLTERAVMQSILLPNGTSWTFEYDSADPNNPQSTATGNLLQITFPTGGYIKYGWGARYYCQVLLSTQATTYVYQVASWTVNSNDGTGEHTWTYSNTYSPSQTPPPYTTTVTDPLGQSVVHTLTSEGGTCSFYETQTQFYDSSSTLIKTVNTTYHADADPLQPDGSHSNAANVVPTGVTTTWPNGQVSKTTTSYDPGVAISSPYPADQILYGLPETKTESDFGNGTPGTVLRTTTTTYQALTSSAYLTNNLLTLPASVVVTGVSGQAASTTYTYDTPSTLQGSGVSVQHDSTSPDGTARGNQTSVSCWRNLPTVANLITSTKFYDTGTAYQVTDPNTNVTTYAYSTTYYGSYPTQVTNALSQSASSVYDLNSGVVTSTTDANGQTTQYSYDSMARLTQAIYPDTGQDTITRQESSFPFTLTVTKKIVSAMNSVSTTVVDGFGRETESQLMSDPSGTDLVDTTYDAIGRKASVTNPYRTSGNVVTSTQGTTTYSYDGLSRPTQVTKPDGSAVKTAYCGGTTLITDEAMHWRRSKSDGLGRMIEVDEPNSTAATVSACPGTGEPIWVTTYGYDTLNDLTSISQGGSRPRTFAYDSLKRLLSSNNPEAGSVSYSYDGDGNVLTKSDSRPMTITYAWDALNRMKTRTYSNSDPTVTYTYDLTTCVVVTSCYNIGRRTGTADAGGSEKWAYDKLGREIGEQRTTNAITKNTSYTYNLDGSLATMTYPSGRTITYPSNAASQPTAATDVANGISYATNGFYTPAGGLMTATLGSLNLTTIYNARLQPCWIYETQSPTSLPYNSSCTGTATAGTILDVKYNYNAGADNGNVVAITNNRDTTRSQSFTYDQVNRIVTAQTPAPCGSNCWSQTFSYDQWANLTSAVDTGIAPPTLSLAVNTNNRISTAGFSYDTAGNQTADLTSAYVWNAESEIKTGGGINYTYDGDGDRVQKSNGKIYWYGSGSQVLDESDAAGNITDEYVYFAGKRVAHRVVSGNVISYYAEDLLGTSRGIASSTGTLCYDADFFPFGGEHQYTNTCGQNYKFMGKERDTETGNDDFGARYYASAYGRFLSADWSSTPAPIPYANLTNPQTFNLYSIVSDNPESFADLDGHFWLGTAADWEDQPAATNQQQAAPPNPGTTQNQTAQQQNSTQQLTNAQEDRKSTRLNSSHH